MNKELTEKTVKNYNKIKIDAELYIDLKVSVCFYGEVGRTNFIKTIVKDLIIIDAREILDFKNLSGFYALEYGEITFVDGILISAMKEGNNILFKNIDNNFNLLYFLNSVIKQRIITSSKGEVVMAHNNFNLFFTSENIFKAHDLHFVGPIVYSFKEVLKNNKLFTKFTSLIIENVHTKCDNDEFGFCYKSCLSGNLVCFDGVTLCFSEDRNLCSFHYKKILQILPFLKMKNYTVDNRTFLYESCINLFFKHDSEELLSILNLNYYPNVIIYDLNTVKTYAYKLAIRNVLNNLKLNRCTLLVGETGVGKTSVIQYICKNAQQYFGYNTTLKIINMSPDIDGFDLIGGYKTLDISKQISDLYSRHNIVKPKIFDNKMLLNFLKDKIDDIEILFLEKCIDYKANFIWKDGILIDAIRNGYWILLDEINLCSDETLDMIDSLLSKREIINYEKKNFEKIEIHKNFRLFACMNPGNDFGKKDFISNNFNRINFFDFTDNLIDIKLVAKNTISEMFSSDVLDSFCTIFFDVKQMIKKRILTNKLEPIISGRTLVRCLNAFKNNTYLKNIDIISVFILTQLDLHSRSIVYSKFSNIFGETNLKIVPTYQEDDYICTSKTQLLMHDIKICIHLNQPLLLQGDTSTGKTSIIFYLAKRYGQKVIRINNHEHTESSDYLGNYVTTPTGFEFKESLFIKAIRNGWWVILDELNLAQSEVLEVLNRLLDDNKEIYLPQKDELIKSHPNFRLFATQNINYGGRKGISKALRNRFIEIFFPEHSESEILEILHLKTKLPKSFCTHMVKVFEKLKGLRNIDYLMTLRDLFKWAKRIPRTLYEVYETGLSIIYEKQRLDEDKKKVLEIFKNVFTKIDNYNHLYDTNDFFKIESNMIEKFSNHMILTKTILKLIKLINAAILCNEPVLLIGETGIGKTKICEIFAKIYGKKFVFLNMHSGIESSDFTGNFMLYDKKIKWQNGPLLSSVIEGNFFLIDEINLAEDAVLERLNSLLEDKREIFVTEIDQNFIAHESFVLFATMNPGTDFGKRELSLALRNRFTEIYYSLPASEMCEIFDTMLIKRNLVNFKFTKDLILKAHSLRNFELFCEFLGCVKNQNLLVKISDKISQQEILQEAKNLAFSSIENNCDFIFKDSLKVLSIYPFLIEKKADSNFDFENKTTLCNLKKILRALVVNKGILLEGEPGVGKTSIVFNLSKIIGKRYIRINLSEQTELSDLIGTFLPVGNEVKFVKSQLTKALELGWWIILDEINLCSQSVIEGLNSVLDYRKRLILPECTIYVHPETKIFATMNPFNNLNGRKILPKSFRDRFVNIYMNEYNIDDIKKILQKSFKNYKLFPNCSLRENIKRNIFIVSEKEITYKITDKMFIFGNFSFNIENANISSEYVFIHSQLKQLEIIFNAVYYKIPLIIDGGFGIQSLIKFLSQLFDIPSYDLICHKDIDTTDLLGQYYKNEDGVFVWRDSLLIQNVISGSLCIFYNPELIEKCIFDRCNSLFESDRFINIYEKGIDTDVLVNEKTRFVLLVDNLVNLSPALIDRCIVVKLSNVLSYIDVWKIFFREKSTYSANFQVIKDELLDKKCNKKLKLANINFSDWVKNEPVPFENIDLAYKKFNRLSEIPNFFVKNLSNIYNEIFESNIDEMFKFYKKDIFFDETKVQYIEFYKNINFNIRVGKNDREKLQILKNIEKGNENIKALTFIKNLNLEVLSMKNANKNECELSIPLTIQELKEDLLFSYKDKSLKDIHPLNILSLLAADINLIFIINFDDQYFDMLLNLKTDPLLCYKEYLTWEKQMKENDILQNIYDNIKSIYKYGRGEISSLLHELEILNNNFSIEISKINIKLDRNFEEFKSKFLNLDLCSYYSDNCNYSLFNRFDDILDYYLLFLYNLRKYSKRCLGFCKKLINTQNLTYEDYLRNLKNFVFEEEEEAKHVSYKNVVANFLHNKELLNHLKDFNYTKFSDYLCKFIYNIRYKKGLDLSNLIFEACIYKNVFFNCIEGIDPQCQLPELYINECLKDISKVKETAQILDNRQFTLYYTYDLVNLISSLSHLSIFIKPEDLYEKIIEYLKTNKVHKTLADNILSINNLEEKISDFVLDERKVFNDMNIALKKITKYFKNSDSLTWPTNYKYFLYLEIHNLTPEMAERYFFDCQVYEFYDRMKFAELKAIDSRSVLFYNLVLQYKAFEIESQVNKKINEARNKLRKEPKLFEKIRNEVIEFVTLPTTNILDLSFNKPQCCCKDVNINLILYKFTKDIADKCICERFINLAEDFNRNAIQNMLDGMVFQNVIPCYSKKYLITKFYNRKVDDKFSYNEICLSKVINKITEDSTHLKLISFALENPFPPFLYFIFHFADDNSNEYEDGTGIKGGTGEKNISDKIEDQDEISDEYSNKNNVEEEDGIDFENEGSMSTVDESEDKNNDIGVDGNEDSEQKENVEEKEDEENYNFEDNEGVGESSDGFDEGIEEENNGSTCSENEQAVNDPLINQNEELLLDHKNDVITEYQYKEGQLNQNQTCEEAVDYDRKVFGENLEEALCPGEGIEEIEGNQNKGEKESVDHVLDISYKESTSEKLILMLRNILESNKYSKFIGDYKSGKKLNLKRLIPYIASDYRKDKIWMKRRRSDKKEYIIRIFIDNSKSMYNQEMVNILFILFSRLKNSFKALNIPVQLYRFGNILEECEIQDMTFTDNETNVDWIEEFKDGVNIVLTDGIFQKTGFYNKNFLVILIDKNDICNMSKVSVTDGNIFIQKYLELFSLRYCVIKNIEELESTFILALSELIKNY